VSALSSAAGRQDPSIALARWTTHAEPSALQELLASASHPDVTSFALGLPAEELFPRDAYAAAVQEVLREDPRALQYGPPSSALREHVVELMRLRGVECRAEQVLLTAGAQQGVSLLSRLLLSPGASIITEEHVYPGFQQAVQPFEPVYRTVPTDRQSGLDVTAVEHVLRRERPAFIYASPEGHNPLSVSMARETRARLTALAAAYQVPIIEDDVYGFLGYGEAASPPMLALDPDFVLYVGSFSKILAPALRVGWLVVPPRLLRLLSVLKESTDIDTSTLSQRAVAAYLSTGSLPAHLTRLRHAYRDRRDTMLAAVARHFGTRASWRRPSHGVFVWLDFPDGLDTGAILPRALERERVAFLPSEIFSVPGGPRQRNGMRLNFSHCAPARIDDGIARLARLLDTPA
jgi:2-aminoadipate transaminase